MSDILQDPTFWYIEKIETPPVMGTARTWQVYDDGYTIIDYTDIQSHDLAPGETRFQIADTLTDLGVYTTTSERYEQEPFEVILPGVSYLYPRVRVRSSRLSGAEAMFLCGLVERRDGQSVVDYCQEVSQLGALMLDQPDLAERLRQYQIDKEVEKNPLFGIEILGPDATKEVDILSANIAKYEVAKRLVSDFRILTALMPKVFGKTATREEVDRFMTLRKQLDDDMATTNLTMRLGTRPDGVTVDSLVQDPQYIEFVFRIPSPDRRGFVRVPIGKLSPAELSGVSIALARTGNYVSQKAVEATARIATAKPRKLEPRVRDWGDDWRDSRGY